MPPFIVRLVELLHRAFGVAPGMFRAQIGARTAPEQLLELYATEGCPACRRVRRRLTELDLDFIQRSCPVGPSPKRERLLSIGGRMQVPYLVDRNTGVALYESADIVAYLDQRYGAAALAQLPTGSRA